MRGAIRYIKLSRGNLKPTRLVKVSSPYLILSFLVLLYLTSSDDDICGDSSITSEESVRAHSSCEKGYFLLPGMDKCHPLLSCAEINSPDFIVSRWLGGGAVKNIYHACWKGHHVVATKLIWWKFGFWRDVYLSSANIFLNIGPNKYVNQFIGSCGETHVLQYHPLGPAKNFESLINSKELNKQQEIKTRLGLCISYLEVLKFIHNSPVGTMVMCDSNSVNKVLVQYLMTSDFRLVLNDIEDVMILNRTKNEKIKCGIVEVAGPIVAPEQRWPYPNRPFNLEEQPAYDEKSDIYKAPDVCVRFLGGSDLGLTAKSKLLFIHRKCKSVNPEDRPDASQVLEIYKQLLSEL